MEITITHHEDGDHGEYRAHIEGSPAIGRLTWTKRGGAHVAEHTVVPPAIGNRGVAARLVEAMVADARKRSFKVQPECSYVVTAFKRHPEWADVHV